MANTFALTLPSPYSVDLREGMAAGSMQMPAPTVTMSVSTSASMTVDATFPWPMTSVVTRGADIAASLPALQSAGITGTVIQNMTVDATLPWPMTLSASATITGLFSAPSITLPTMTAAMQRGSAIGVMTLPKLTGSASIVSNATTSAAMLLPALRAATITIQPMQAVMHAMLILPALTGLSGSTRVAAALPALQATVLITNGSAAVRQQWAVNIKNLAVTKFTGFEFRQFARAYDRYYGAGLDSGLYLVGGDNDAGAPIAWSWRTGMSDLGSRALKGVLGLYVDGVAEPGCDFEVLTERGTYLYAHKPHGTINDRETQRVSVGRSLRTVNIGYGMKSDLGAYVEIDSLNPEYQIHDHRSM